ncbi:hypothetical protein HHK36_023381 [Tetracentron sinense]|uniref:F-box domain-containing protein n=1 Tax=Tetracentron sinense TaxID=13715 RepID=A0A835D5T4_TETSI|nr:hypothetical protein HHK36_023381 [Tetracentron sinense]
MNDTEEEKNPFSKLPSDILLDIFSRIPAKALFDSRWVCKSRFNLVRDPRLAKMHLARASQNENPSIIFETYGKLYILDNIKESNVPIKLKFPFMGSDPNFSLVGSCNGLVCKKALNDLRVIESCKEKACSVSNVKPIDNHWFVKTLERISVSEVDHVVSNVGKGVN